MTKFFKLALLLIFLSAIVNIPVRGVNYYFKVDGRWFVKGTDNTVKYVHIPVSYSPHSGQSCLVVGISDNAFLEYRNLLAVTFDSTSCLEVVGKCAFANCTRMTTIVLPDSVAEIKPSAFAGCARLNTFRMPKALTTIGDGAFRNCGNLTTVEFTAGGLKTLGNYAFYGCTGLAEMTLPYTVTNIGRYAFMECSGLALFKGSGSSAFGRLPEGVFARCASLRSVTNIPYVAVVAKRALQGCAKLTTIDRLDSLRVIEESAFRGCAKLESFSISQKLTSVGDSAFMGCANLREIAFPGKDAEVIICRNAFDGCSGLESARLPRNIPAIQPCTFKDCASLRSITIPVSVTAKIGDSAFMGCAALDSVTCLTEAPHKFGKDAFKNISPKCVLTVPYGKRAAYIAKGWTEDVFKGGVVELPAPEGIQAVRVNRVDKGTYYDLEGREVLQPEKGRIYIRKGRKVLVK